MTENIHAKEAREFRKTFEVNHSTITACKLIQEEHDEFMESYFKFLSPARGDSYEEVASAMLKELADLVYVCYQYALTLDLDLDEALTRVHKSNMSKLDEEGKIIRREDGKILKGPRYAPPNLHDLV